MRKTFFLCLPAIVVLLSADVAPAADRTVAKLRTGQERLVTEGTARVVLRAPRAGRYTVVLGLVRRGGGRRMPAGRRTIRVGSRGRRIATVRLRRGARRSLRTCRRYRLTLTVRRNGRRVARGRMLLRRNACPGTTSTSQTGPGTGTAARPGAGAPGGPPAGTPGQGRPPEEPGFDTADADRCDVLDPAVCLQPFPNDHFTVADETTATGRRLNLQDASMPKNREGKPISAADYNFSDGFSPGNMLITRVPGLETPEAFRASALPPVDAPQRSLEPGSPVVVLNTETGQRHLVWAELDANPDDPEQRNLIIRPATNFEEGTRYVVALRGLRRADGTPIPAQRPFAVYRDRITTTDPEVEQRRGAMESMFATLRNAGVAREDLYLAWDFTTASADSTTSRMLSIRDRAFAELGDTNLADRAVQGVAPTYTINPDDPTDSPLTEQTDGVRDFPTGQIARTVRGTIVVPCFLSNPGCPPLGSRFLLTGDGREPQRIPGNTTTQDFTCHIPRRATDPEQGPLRGGLYGHGLFGSQSEAGSGQLRAFMEEHGFIFCAVDWNGMSTKDVPNVVTILQDLSNFPTLTDHVQQGFLGFLLLGRAMIHPDGMSDDPAFTIGGRQVLDPSALYYDGNSQGGIYGGSLTAVAPDFERATLGVPGMNYSTLLRRSVDFDMYAEGNIEGAETEVGLYDAYPSELERPLILSLIQLLWDRSEPNGYAHHMTTDPLPNTPEHQVLLQVAFGDHQVADVTAEVEARTIGALMHKPGLEESRSRFRDRPYPHEPEPDPFFGLAAMPDGHTGSGMVFWDTGPYTGTPGAEDCESGQRGTPPPPAGNVPPREGCDPHGAPRSDPDARVQKSEFLQPDGRIEDVCGGPCFAGPYAGSG